jgi:3-methyladenine DNA glycosylase/8-oxoguanine DNA glycosylase
LEVLVEDSRRGDFFFFFVDDVDIQVRAGRGRCIVDYARESKEKLRAGKKSYANWRSIMVVVCWHLLRQSQLLAQ